MNTISLQKMTLLAGKAYGHQMSALLIKKCSWFISAACSNSPNDGTGATRNSKRLGHVATSRHFIAAVFDGPLYFGVICPASHSPWHPTITALIS